DLICGHRDHFIHVVLTDFPGILADLLDRHTIGEDTHLIQHHTLAGFHGRLQAVGVFRLHPNYFDFRVQILDVGRHAGNQPAATDTDKDCVDRLAGLPHDLHGHGALTGVHLRVIAG